MTTHTRGAARSFAPLATEEDVLACFRLLLGRLPGEHEWEGHRQFVGKPLADVVAIYVNAPEFKARKLVGYSLDSLHWKDFDGYGMYVPADDLMVGVHILASGTYEPAVTRAFRELLRPGMRVIDVGANIGWFSCLSAHLVGATGRVVSVEAGQSNTKVLMMNRLRNAWDHLHILNVAASDRPETLLYSSNSSNGFVREARDVGEIAGAEPVGAIPLGPLLEDGKPWHLVKIDVEGYEQKALDGLQALVRRWRPTLVIEFSPPALANLSGVSGEQFLNDLIAAGYSVTVLLHDGPEPCGADAARVMALYETARSDHIDLLMCPR